MTGIRRSILYFVVICWSVPFVGAAWAQDIVDHHLMRVRMIKTLTLQSILHHEELGLPEISSEILSAMAVVPRHEFVPDHLAPVAYLDTPLPIGHGQNIAQPYIVALMTELAEIGPEDTVFETGTGAGYHAAILSRLARRVYSVEIVRPLAERAMRILDALSERNVEIRVADGYDGWPEKGPFDAMIIKESVVDVPSGLLSQLAPGGRMVVPVGPADGPQFLTIIRRDATGQVTRQKVLPVRFSPFQGGQRT